MSEAAERAIAKECFFLLGVLIVFFISAVLSENQIFAKIYLFLLYGYPVYISLRLIIYLAQFIIKIFKPAQEPALKK